MHRAEKRDSGLISCNYTNEMFKNICVDNVGVDRSYKTTFFYFSGDAVLYYYNANEGEKDRERDMLTVNS